MIFALIGHRGSGKTSALFRIRSLFEANNTQVLSFDLDQEIEKKYDINIQYDFAEIGELEFRAREQQTFDEIYDRCWDSPEISIIAVGAGFSGVFPEEVMVIWIQRPTDGEGRIFFDRPALDSNKSAYQEDLDRKKSRDWFYAKQFHYSYEVPEGFEKSSFPGEEVFWGFKSADLGATLSLRPEHFKNLEQSKRVFKNFGIRLFEIRDDILSPENILMATESFGKHELLMTARKEQDFFNKFKDYPHCDWPLEWGEPQDKVEIVSLHERDEDILKSMEKLSKLESSCETLKFAPLINNFKELELCHNWWIEKPNTRCFLPSSSNGRWSWYRDFYASQMKLNFVRIGIGTSLDQPNALLLVGNKTAKQFAAVLGSPVDHCRTPFQHFHFFSQRNCPVYSVEMTEEELTQESLSFLRSIGLKYAAITSPLKGKVSQLSSERTQDASEYNAVNTIFMTENSLFATNTDFQGLKKSATNNALIGSEDIVLWGGGGTKDIVKTVFPNIRCFAARNPELDGVEDLQPEVLVWAVGRNHMVDCGWPPWRPRIVFDLNYSEDSPGREFALNTGAKYISGLDMFEAQAEFQQYFWKECEVN